jgi:anti-sigma factor RsiW
LGKGGAALNTDDETVLLVAAYHDGELSPSETLAMERRLTAEPELRALAAHLRDLSSGLKQVLPTDSGAPERMRISIVREIGLSEDMPEPRRRASAWMAIAASLLVGIALGGGLVYGVTIGSQSSQQSVSDTVFAAHLRSLVAPQPFDIASSDRHVVKPWFNGRTAIAPATPDLVNAGFPLIGGRLDIVAGVPMPVLVYRHDRHIISVTIVPRQPDGLEREESRDGSNIHRWNSGDLSYWAVSDLNNNDLRQFVAAFKAASQ